MLDINHRKASSSRTAPDDPPILRSTRSDSVRHRSRGHSNSNLPADRAVWIAGKAREIDPLYGITCQCCVQNWDRDWSKIWTQTTHRLTTCCHSNTNMWLLTWSLKYMHFNSLGLMCLGNELWPPTCKWISLATVQSRLVYYHLKQLYSWISWRMYNAEEGPTLRVESSELSKTLRWCERLINSII